jgi:hypothetical protein
VSEQIYFRAIGWSDRDWIDLAQNRDQPRAVVMCFPDPSGKRRYSTWTGP